VTSVLPYVVGAHAGQVLADRTESTGLRRDVRQTSGVLRAYGTLSSGSFLFSYARLQEEGVVRPGEYGVLMTMGLGSTIGTVLIR
jgi:polyketide synthase Type III